MTELFKLVSKEFSEIDKEWQWTYRWLSEFIFNGSSIIAITITDHYQQKPGREMITNELILNVFWEKLNQREMKSFKKCGNRDIYVWEWVHYQRNYYHLTFWFKDDTDNHLWIRNCYPIS